MDKNLVNINPADFAEGSGKKVKPPMGPMDLPQKKLTDLAHKTYHVYKDRKEFVEVEALTASEALEKSGVKNAFKVKRSHVDIGTLIEEKMIVNVEPPAQAAAEAPAPTAVAAPAPETPPAAAQ